MSGSDASRMIPSGLLFTVAVLEELKLLLSGNIAPGRCAIRGLCLSPEIERLYTLDIDSALLLKAAKLAADNAGDRGTTRTVRSLGLRAGRLGL